MQEKYHIVIGAGPLGIATAEALVRSGKPTLVVSRSPRNLPGAIHYSLDILDRAMASTKLPDAEVIYQCSRPPYTLWPALFPELQNAVIRLAQRKKAKLVVAENLSMFGAPDHAISEQSPMAPLGPQGEVRAAMSEQLLTAGKNGDLIVTIGRASDFYGPGVENSLVGARFFSALQKGKTVQYLGDPDARHSLTYIKDFGQALMLLGGDSRANGKAFHVASAPAVSWNSLITLASSLMKIGFKSKRVSRWQLRALGLFIADLKELIEVYPFFEKPYIVDDTAYRRLTGAQATQLDFGLEQAIRWNYNQLQKLDAPHRRLGA